jgi:sortase A
MVEQARQNQKQIDIDRLERWTLFSGILIWAGVLIFGIGLFVTLRNQRLESLAYASQSTPSPTVVASASATATPPPTATPQRYPAGWSTATPTPLAWTPTPEPDDSSTSGDTSEDAQETPEAESETRAAPNLAVTPQAPPPPAVPPDRLVIPSIDLDSPIVPIGWHTVEVEGMRTRVWEVADYTVGWHQTSSYPGRGGNIVLNGHHNIKGQVFRYLVELEPGDQIYLYAQEKVYTFAVTEKHILKEKGESLEVRRENARWIEPTDDERLTMITCWPYTNNTHRLVIVARPVPTRSIDGLHE